MTSPIDITFLRDTRHGGAQAQPTEIASRLADFVEAATHSIDIAIYDFRLTDSLAGPVVSALIAAADRGVVVRIGYDEGKPAAGTATDFAALGADPAPIGTAQWVTEHFAGTAVQIKGIAAGRQLMHSKYVIRDAAAGSAAVWTGSMNFTDDAWTLQENNILTIESRKLARAFRTDFGQMWTPERSVELGPGTAAQRPLAMSRSVGTSPPATARPSTPHWFPGSGGDDPDRHRHHGAHLPDGAHGVGRGRHRGLPVTGISMTPGRWTPSSDNGSGFPPTPQWSRTGRSSRRSWP